MTLTYLPMSTARCFAAISCILLLACGDDGGGGGGAGSVAFQPSPSTYANRQCDATPDVPGCTEQEVETYLECWNDACDPTYLDCFGPNYKSGVYSCPCKAYLDCVTACGCSDSACYEACPGASECSECVAARPCGMDCKWDCGDSSESGACDDLERCCNSLTDFGGALMPTCLQAASTTRTNPNSMQRDMTCRQLLSSYEDTYGCE